MSAVAAQPSALPAVVGEPMKMNQEQFTNRAASEFARLMAQDKIERPPIPIEDGHCKITDFNQAQRVAATICTSGAYPESWVPKNADRLKSIAAITICLLYGAENGFSLTQTMTCVYIVNGKPALYGDGPIAKVYASGKMHDIREEWTGEGDAHKCTVTVWRLGRDGKPGEPKTRSFSVADARARGYMDKEKWSLWKSKGDWPRMIQCRARAWVLRDTFPDVLMGLLIAEEYVGTDVAEPSLDATINQRLAAAAVASASAPAAEPGAPGETKPPAGETNGAKGETEGPRVETPAPEVKSAECTPGEHGCDSSYRTIDGRKVCDLHRPADPAPAPLEAAAAAVKPLIDKERAAEGMPGDSNRNQAPAPAEQPTETPGESMFGGETTKPRRRRQR